ncbi:hypothetical protein HPB52_012064 [Rhipicephalus sanguineus]|uniref:Uncharacterized protein n=1 Tax=Rhipicephalus sanguineus TaxID=34632 RepID=A0A9D4T3I8_RHISA|nr:hypothetical protein HPB52_012064 [Rhipicephalus sanguineus]
MVVNFDGEWKKEDLFSHLQSKNVFAEQDCASLSLQTSDLLDAEDDESIAAHISSMQKELRKGRPDYDYVRDSMLRTFAARREWIFKEIPSMEAITDKYPALMLASFAQNEFQSQTKVLLLEKLQDVLT